MGQTVELGQKDGTAKESAISKGSFADGTPLTQEKLEELRTAHRAWGRTFRRKLEEEWGKAKGKGQGRRTWMRELLASDWEADQGRLVLKGAHLSYANLKGDLSTANLEGADLGNANLKGAYLTHANLKGANLEKAYLKGANLGNAYLKGAKLFGADLEGADLSNANLEGAVLGAANLEGANLGNENLEGAYLGAANLEGQTWGTRTWRGQSCGTRTWRGRYTSHNWGECLRS